MANNILITIHRRASGVIINHVQRRNMPVNVPPTATGKRRFRFAVETDADKLVNFCCGLNYHNDQEPIKLKPDEEYPEWLWNLRLGPEKNSWEMEKGTKEYYLRLAKEGQDRNYLLKMTAPKKKMVVGKNLKRQAELIHNHRFAALAHLEDDIGLEPNSMDENIWGPMLRVQENARDYYIPMMENKVVYADKIATDMRRKNIRVDEDSSFKGRKYNMNDPLPVHREAIQDSKRRHRYAST